WTAVRDLDGLRADTENGRRAGFFGRSVIHPAQLPVVHEACRPDPDDVAWARSLVDTVRETGEAAWVDSTGRFVDKAVVERALWLLAADEDPNVKEGQTSCHVPRTRCCPPSQAACGCSNSGSRSSRACPVRRTTRGSG